MRFFRRKDEPRPAPAEAVGDPAEEQVEAPYGTEEEPEGEPEGETEDERAADESWTRRAAAVIVGGSSTGSKRREALYGEGAEFGPTHYERASGCELVTAGGRTLIDCTMALGAVAIGYADDRVTRAAVAAMAAGGACGLSSTFEVEVAERLSDVIPCAERVRFLKSGAEAVAAAVRIARTYTGRPRVVASGYFGWLDWASATAKGVPAGARSDVTHVPFDDVAALERAALAASGDLAAIVVEPVVERLPSPAWLAAARSLCDRTGAVLVFDEIKTGFRVAGGGYQALSGVTPDLATFGKALANGFPLAAVVGRADVMEAARDTWISSTLAGEAVALAAASAVLDHHEAGDVCAALAERGRAMREGFANAVEQSGATGVEVGGIDPMWFARWESPAREQRFLELALEHGVLFKRGPYNFASLAHGDEIITDVEAAASHALVALLEEEEELGGEDDA